MERSAIDPRILLKREDRNPTGSHKDRAAALQLALARTRGDRAVVISSSGNAGIATAHAAARHGVPAFVFVHPATDERKLAAIDGSCTTVIVTPRAINGAKLVCRELGLPNLRPSTNDDAVVGYRSLALELAGVAEQFDTVVLFATSGATALAVADQLADAVPHVQVHFVQGEGNAALVDPDAAITDRSAHNAAAGRLGVRRSRRARALRAAIERTGGRGHVASADDVVRARRQLESEGIVVSDESAANFAVAQRLADEGRNVVCVISGAPPPAVSTPAARIEAADEHEALERIRELL